MAVVDLRTRIYAPVGRCFDRARNVDVHLATARATGERAVAGATAGLLGAGDTATWRARHLGWSHELTVRITAFAPPHFFRDEQVRGPFARFRHDHRFWVERVETVMADVLEFAAPFGLLGRLADVLVLAPHLRRFLCQRARALWAPAESDDWERCLAGDQSAPGHLV